MYKPIEDYAIIGNRRSAVLVSKDGSIDWAPAPFIDSPTIFAAMLDDVNGGYWQVAPSSTYTSTQNYSGLTNVLETHFKTKEGSCVLTDYLPIEEGNSFDIPENDTTFKIKRKIACVKGSCKLEMVCHPRFDYARGPMTLTPLAGGVLMQQETKCGVLASHEKLSIHGERVVARFTLTEGETRFFVLRYGVKLISRHDVDENHGERHEQELEKTKKQWEDWAKGCDFQTCPVVAGPWQDIIQRSSLVLKILFFEPVGTVAAAATASLPEEIGGVRNWDYRYTWLRDSSFVFDAFFQLGHVKEAEQYLHWILKECKKGKGPEDLKIMYTLTGDSCIDEEILTHLKGYKNSRPVRIGNAAHRQKQWDIYGSVLNIAWDLHALKGKGAISKENWDILRAVANYVVGIWRLPDEGLWEVRGGKAHFTYSKVMCWVAFDRALKIAKAYNYEGEIELWKQERDAIYAEVMSRGWNDSTEAFVYSLDATDIDATALLFSKIGFIKGDDPKMIATIRTIQRKLDCGDALLFRHTFSDGLPGSTGADLFASFWLVDALVLAGEVEEARMLFEKLVSYANHVGLYSEEMDPQSKSFLGNFPQAYTHVGLINSAILLTQALELGKES